MRRPKNITAIKFKNETEGSLRINKPNENKSTSMKYVFVSFVFLFLRKNTRAANIEKVKAMPACGKKSKVVIRYAKAKEAAAMRRYIFPRAVRPLSIKGIIPFVYNCN